MKKKILKTTLAVICVTLLCACKQTSLFYNPDTIISERYDISTDTIYGDKVTEMFARVRALSCIDNYMIIIQENKDTLFRVLDMKNDSVIASFGCKGHARNEFAASPWAVYCIRDKNSSPQLFVWDGESTKIVDIEKSIEANKCIIKDIIKENADRHFCNTFHIGNNIKFVYKTVSYDDARDAVYIPPLYYMTTGDTKLEWNIHPNIISPEWSNMVDAAYSNEVWIKPDGLKAISVANFIDIVNFLISQQSKWLAL